MITRNRMRAFENIMTATRMTPGVYAQQPAFPVGLPGTGEVVAGSNKQISGPKSNATHESL